MSMSACLGAYMHA
uniref:Uncharacterized protein n=1 Tax=Arundo donax TaxID=35708 RepID=A0A0A9BSP8_ARUDO